MFHRVFDDHISWSRGYHDFIRRISFRGRLSETPPRRNSRCHRSDPEYSWNLATWDLADTTGSSETTTSASALNEPSLALRKFEHRFDASRTPSERISVQFSSVTADIFVSFTGARPPRRKPRRTPRRISEIRHVPRTSVSNRRALRGERFSCHSARVAPLRARVAACRRAPRRPRCLARALSLPLLRVSPLTGF